MENDIVPDLLATIQSEFDNQVVLNPKLKKLLAQLSLKKATYLDANEFAIEIGKVLTNVFEQNVSVEVLPNGKMYFNIAERLLNPTLKNNYDLISSYVVDLQTELNHSVGLKIKGQSAEINQDRIVGLINKISDSDDFNDVKWLLKEPIINFSQSVVDDAIKENVEFQSKAGFSPKIKRSLDNSKACKWCRNLEGTYEYPDVPSDVYRRHERCQCTVEYIPNGKKRQDVWSKDWIDPDKKEKVEARKQMNLTERKW
ncbi:hypothetical protein P7H60_06315 [Vagococcus carniphilus]|uniref:hypothetical protein n=1 Tax=Vagococcus carniphilus TaxID=218144 RepID=UPI0028929368|nr:hypothetical protein [Vagococcus carniphilus]MDT2848770.1 hypothetical protein [Vagococcus carniphilus]